jgi:hypothetical protein
MFVNVVVAEEYKFIYIFRMPYKSMRKYQIILG